jgi:hypothetical protein
VGGETYATLTHMQIYIYPHYAHTHKHTRIHTYTHTHIHTYKHHHTASPPWPRLQEAERVRVSAARRPGGPAARLLLVVLADAARRLPAEDI